MVASQHPPKCPCCNNPWANGEFFAKLCQECKATEPQGQGLSRDNMDFDVLPKVSFSELSGRKLVVDAILNGSLCGFELPLVCKLNAGCVVSC